MCVVIPFVLDVRLVDAPAEVTQEEGHTGFLHLPSAVLVLFFIARKIQPSHSLVDCEIEFCVPSRSTVGAVGNVANLSTCWEGTARE